MGDLTERCILETKAGRKLLFSRSIHDHDMSAQVHDGEKIVAEMFASFAKRGQNFMVRTYRHMPTFRQVVTETRHGTKHAAHNKMERLAIQQWKEHNEGEFKWHIS